MGSFCLAYAYFTGKLIASMLPPNPETDPFAYSIGRILSLSKDPAIRNRQKKLIRWIAAAVLCFFLAASAQIAFFIQVP